MSKDSILVEAIKAVFAATGYSANDLKEKAPRDFWKSAYEVIKPSPYFGSKDAMSNYFGKGDNKNRILALLDENYSGNTNSTTPESTEQPRDKVYFSSPTYQFTEQDIRNIVQDELSKQKDSVMSEHTGNTELVPEADIDNPDPKARKKREYHRLSVTVDKELWKAFRAEQKKLNATTPRLIDSILWAHYGRPKLSFEK